MPWAISFCVPTNVVVRIHLPFDFRDHAFERLRRDRPLLARADETAHDLAAVELDATPVLLNHPDRVDLDFFIRREAPAARQALPPPADRSGIP